MKHACVYREGHISLFIALGTGWVVHTDIGQETQEDQQMGRPEQNYRWAPEPAQGQAPEEGRQAGVKRGS